MSFRLDNFEAWCSKIAPAIELMPVTKKQQSILVSREHPSYLSSHVPAKYQTERKGKQITGLCLYDKGQRQPF